jgi:predicted transcriptional regulator
MDVQIHVGYDPSVFKARFLAAVRRVEAGDSTPESHITFESWEGLSRTLSGKRLELLRQLHKRSAASVAELARALGRDYKRVHEDVEILAAVGLVDRSEAGEVSAPYDEIRTVISFAPAA